MTVVSQWRMLNPICTGGATVSMEYGDEVVLRYDGLPVEVVLLTEEADDRFKREHPNIVAANEEFVIDDAD